MRRGRPRARVALALSLVLAAGARAQDAQSPAETTDSEETLDLEEAVRAALAAGATDPDGELYRACVARHGDVDPLLDLLEEAIDDEDAAEDERRDSRRLLASVLYRHGELKQALEHVEELARGETDADVALLRARLLDATGRTEDALAAYEALVETRLDTGLDAELEGTLRLRIAMITTARGGEDEGALAAYAREAGRDAELANRAAVVLALLGRPEDAIELFVVGGEGTELFRAEARLAEWALTAADAPVAQEHAWRAFRSATLRRDRHYALTLLIEAHRADDSLATLIERFGAEADLAPEAQSVRIDLLRETGRAAEALELFRGASEELDVAMRRELLEMYREAGQEDVMTGVYRGLIQEQPEVSEWREGLSRFLLERGNREAAREVWASFVAEAEGEPLLWGAETLMALGLDDEAVACAERWIALGGDPAPALLFRFGLHKDRGDLTLAEEQLERLDELAPPDAAARMQLGEAFEQIGKLVRAVEVLDAVKAARPEGEVGEDLEMRLAWLYSEIDDEERAMEAWLDLWRRVSSIPRRRYVEDRMMTVAARLGTLADIAIELEEKLVAGTANERESGLLVRLYTKVSDAVSAAEVIDEYFKHTGGSEVESLQEKARVYVACTDFHDYEKTVHRLMEVDPEGRPDYLRQLAMSMLERGKPEEAREVLHELAELEAQGTDASDSSEFEAGVLALAGLRDEAIAAYRRGLAADPGRIDSYLLLANLLKELGETERAVGTFQYLAETADKDDLFTVAIDGLLNMEAPPDVLQWARRVTLERLAGRHDKMYLYQLLSDLSEELDERDQMIVALENSLAIAGERRPSILRELMDLARGGAATFNSTAWEGDTGKHLAFGRRLIGLEELVPPQVYLDLGEAFLNEDAVPDARKTFRLARDLPDYDVFQRQAAGLLEDAGYLEAALEEYQRVLVTQPSDVSLLAKVGELSEQVGRDDVARELYARAVELLLVRRPLASTKAAETVDTSDPFTFFAARNVDDFDQYYERVLKGLLVTLPGGPELEALVAEQREAIESDIAAVLALEPPAEPKDFVLARYPRLLRRVQFLRRLAVAYSRGEVADQVDQDLLARFPDDEGLLEELVRERLRWGQVASARALIDASGRPEERRREVGFLVGAGGDSAGGRPIPLAEATRLFLPLLSEGRTEEARELLLRTDFNGVEKERLPEVQGVFSAALYLDDRDLLLNIGRQWVRLHVKHESYEHEVEPVIERCRVVLDDARQESLCRYFVGLVLEKPESASRYIRMLPRLSERFEEPLVTEEQIAELLDGYGERYAYGLGPVLRLLPADQRSGALRAIWPKVAATSRATFLIQLVSAFEEPLGEDLADLVVESFTASVGDAGDVIKYYVDDLANAEGNVDVVVRMARVLREELPNDTTVGALLAVGLARTDAEEEALAVAKEILFVLLEETNDYYLRQARDKLFETFLPDRLAAFEAALDDEEEAKGPSVELAQRRFTLIEQQDDPEALLAAVLAAVEQFPEEQKLLERLERQYRVMGRPHEALATLERLVELKPDEPALRKRLYEAWLANEDPVRALAVREAGSIEVEGGSPRFDFPPGAVIVMAGGSIAMGPGRTAKPKKGAWPPGKARPASVDRVKEALEGERPEAARVTLRRLWRSYPSGNAGAPRIIYFFGNRYDPTASLKWPADEDEEEEEEPPRGGFDSFDEEEPEEPEERPFAWEILAQHAFGRSEMERWLRTAQPERLDAMQPVCEGLLRSRVLEEGEEPVLRALLERVSAGRAGKLDYVLLLALLDEHPERLTPDVAAVLRDLVRTLNPVDATQLRRLARAFARSGAREEATRLYRWCATQTQSPSRYWGSSGTVSAHELVKEVKEHLEGDDRVAVIESILTFADPGEDTWSREGFELLAMETWEELAGPAEALARCRAMCASTTDLSTGLRRRSAERAAYLYARAGELERAVECLEVALCKLDKDLFKGDDRFRWLRPEIEGSLGHDDLRRLFPREITEWPEAGEWFRAAAAALERWLVEERVRRENTVTALALIALRLHQAGEEDEAQRVVEVLDGLEDLPPGTRLWVADAARSIGLVARAGAIERDLFEERRLNVHRVPALVARVLESEGPEAALALGEQALEVTRHTELLALLERAAREAGVEERATELAAEAVRVTEASAKLEEMDAEAEDDEAEESGSALR